jgi:hypothetical protein
MSRTQLARLSAAAALLLVAACSSAPGRAPAAAGFVEPLVVRFSYEAVTPQTARIPADGNLTWVNAAQESVGFVVFPASIASRFRCADLRPYFSKTADRYHSLPIGGMESERVQLPCALAPGSYAYEVWLMGAGFGAEPQQVLRATIVVE